MDIQQRLITFIKRTNWVLFALTCIAGELLTAPTFLNVIVICGFIVTLNLHLMALTLRKALAPP